MSYQTVGVSGFTSFNKIPEYVIDYKREYLFIRGINKEFMYLINKLDNLNDGLFESNTVNRIKYIMKRFLRGQEKGKLKDINGLFLPYNIFSNFFLLMNSLNFTNNVMMLFVMMIVMMIVMIIVMIIVIMVMVSI